MQKDLFQRLIGVEVQQGSVCDICQGAVHTCPVQACDELVARDGTHNIAFGSYEELLFLSVEQQLDGFAQGLMALEHRMPMHEGVAHLIFCEYGVRAFIIGLCTGAEIDENSDKYEPDIGVEPYEHKADGEYLAYAGCNLGRFGAVEAKGEQGAQDAPAIHGEGGYEVE